MQSSTIGVFWAGRACVTFRSLLGLDFTIFLRAVFLMEF